MPIWVIILSAIFLREHITGKKVIAIIIALIGLSFLFQIDELTFSSGDIFALLSSFAFAGFILNGRALKNTSEYTTTFFQLAIAGLLMLPFMLFNFSENIINNLPITIGLLLFLGIVNTGITQRLFLFGLRHVEASKASVITYLEPVSATIFAFLYYGEVVRPLSFLGIGFILISVLIIFSSAKEKA